MKTSLKNELLKAKKGKYCLAAFNFDNLEMLKAIIEACEEENSPVIVMATESAVKYMGFEYATAIGQQAVASAKVPVILHWDHGFDIEMIKKAIDAKWTSVMLDSSFKPFAENLNLTQQVVAYAKKHHVEVESEIGHVGGKEDDRNSKSNGYTNINEAIEFNKLTNVDALAIAVRTSHGLYQNEVNLQIDLIKQIASQIDTALVLHGCSGVADEQLVQAIDAGICKINIGTELKVAYAKGVQQWFAENPDGYDARKFGQMGIANIKKIVKEKLRILRSNNKA